jgi:hypothetical protein
MLPRAILRGSWRWLVGELNRGKMRRSGKERSISLIRLRLASSMVSSNHSLLLVLDSAEADGTHLPPLHITLGSDHEDWVTIKDVAGTYRGEIYLEMTFFPSGPPLLERRPSKLPPQERLHHLQKPSTAPTAGGNLTVAGAQAYGSSPPRNDKPPPSVQGSQGPTLFPPILRPGTGPAKASGQESRPDGYTSPINSKPPSSLFPSRPPTSPVHQPNNASSFKIPGQHSRPSSSSGYSPSYSPPHPGHSPPRLSHSPPRQSKLEHNPYISDPVPPGNPGSGFFPSPQIMVNSTPSDPASWNPFTNGSNYGPPQPLPQASQQSSPPISTYPGGPSFPSASPQHPPPFHSPQSTSPYPPPQSTFSPPQSGYPQPQSTYPPPSQPGYPAQAPPQFTSHQSTYPAQHQGTYPMYGHASPAPGPGQRPFFGREDSIGELPDPVLTQRYSSPLPLPNGPGEWRSSSPFPVPSMSPQHPTANPYSPSAEYERELQRRREQEERDLELARQLDLELNLRG